MDSLEKFILVAKRMPVKPMSNIAFFGFFILAIYLFSQITWKLIPSTEFQDPWKPSVISTSSHGRPNDVDIKELQKLSLFGKTETKVAKPKPVKQVITDAPKTSLSVQLTGVVASSTEQNGLAIISSGGSQETYSLGDKINGTSAILKEVFSDRVILANAGRYETLMLDGVKYSPNANLTEKRASNRNGKMQKIDKRKDGRLAEKIEAYREKIMKNPGVLADYISISPVRRNGTLVGYSLNPGKDRNFFLEAGLKPNDLAKTLNGYDLTDMNQSIEVMGQLPELTEMSVVVERQGQLVEILLSLPQ